MGDVRLEAIARACRVQIIRMLTHAGSGHPGGSLSVINSIRYSASASTMSAAEIGMTLCTTLIGIDGRLTSASVASIGSTEAPTQPSSAKNAMTMSSATMLNARRARHAIASSSSGQPMCARLTDASAAP